MAKKQRKRGVTCWLLWTWNEDETAVVQVTYWRPVVHETKVSGASPDRWWNAERAAMSWARRKGFQVIKEKLHGK